MEIKEVEKPKIEWTKEKQLRLLHAQQKMLDATQQEILERGGGADGAIRETNLLNNAYKEEWEKNGYSQPTFTPEELKRDASKYAEYKPEEVKTKNIEKTSTKKEKEKKAIIKVEETIIDLDVFITEEDEKVEFDVIPLPSKGLVYPKGHPLRKSGGKIAVTYLVSSDEDIIFQPHLYSNGDIFNIILRKKIKDKNIDPRELVMADRDAILIWLRSSGYGKDYPLSTYDPQSDSRFDTSVDLTSLKFIKPNVKTDENGLFEYELPLSKDKVKFKILNITEEQIYEKYLQLYSEELKSRRIMTLIEDTNFIINNYNFDEDEISKLEENRNNLNEVLTVFEEQEKDISNIGRFVTKRLELQIKEYIKKDSNGNEISYKEQEDINSLIRKMRVADSRNLRNYIKDNTPMIDLNIEVVKPESIGGGSLKTTFSIDQSIFFNIS